MKRAIIAIIILSCAAVAYCSLSRRTAADRRDLAAQTTGWQGQKKQLEQLRLRQQQVLQHIQETKQTLASQPALPPASRLEQKVLSGASWHAFTPAECEQLLAELGFNWNTTGDYLIISKKSFDEITFNPLHGANLTSAAIGALGLADDEVSAINDLTKQLHDARVAWDEQHVERTEPSGNVLAQYSLPVDQDFSGSQAAMFTNGIASLLGAQRTQWFLEQSQRWQQDNGLSLGADFSKVPADMLPLLPDSARTPQPTTMTLASSSQGNGEINLTLCQAGSTMSTTISPHQPVPEAFKPLFPGGWQQIAEMEGFQLPKSFAGK